DIGAFADRVLELCKLALRKAVPSPNFTGIVIAGFGSEEIFPTLISFQIEGIVSSRLKFIRTDKVDIDRAGPKARVIPFAQKDMVERFLYGLDEKIERQVTQFCGEAVKAVSSKIFEHLDFDDEGLATLVKNAAGEAEKAFTDGLGT